MIRITRSRHEWGGILRSDDSSRTVPPLVALRNLCLGDIKWGALVALATPERIETIDFCNGTTTRVAYEPVDGLEQMPELLKAASAVAARSREDAELCIAARERAYRRQQDNPYGGIEMAMTGLGLGAVGRQKACKALIAALDVLTPEQLSRLEKLVPEVLFTIVGLGADFGTVEERLARVEKTMALRQFDCEEVFRHVINSSLRDGIAMSVALDVVDECLKANIFIGWSPEVLALYGDGVLLSQAAEIVKERHYRIENYTRPKSRWRKFIDDVRSMRWARHLRWGH